MERYGGSGHEKSTLSDYVYSGKIKKIKIKTIQTNIHCKRRKYVIYITKVNLKMKYNYIKTTNISHKRYTSLVS